MLNRVNNVSFTGSYSKTIQDAGKIFNKENYSKNPYLMRDFQSIDAILITVAKELDDVGEVKLIDKGKNLELLISSIKDGINIKKRIDTSNKLFEQITEIGHSTIKELLKKK